MASVIETVLRLRDEVSDKLKGVSKSVDTYGKNMTSVGYKVKRAGIIVEGFGKSILSINAPLIGVGAAAVKIGMDFDQSMSQVQAITASTGAELELLRNKAREIGAVTSKSAKDAADAMIFLGQAGYSNNEILKLSEPLVKLAIAGNIDMARASSLLADSMHSANISMGDSQKYLDIVAKTANVSNTSIEQLMEAFIGAGGSLRTAKISMSEAATMLGILANAGIKGSEAGTSLSRIFMNLSSASGEAQKAMSALNISISDGNGNLRSKLDVLMELKQKTDNLTEAERNQYIQMIGGKQYANDLKILLDGLGPSYDSLHDKIENSTGALEKMAKTMADNLAGDIDEFMSAVEDAAISLSDALTPSIRDTIKMATDLVTSLSKMNPTVLQAIAKFVVFTTAIGGISFVVGKLIKTWGSLIINTGKVIRLLAGLGPTGLIVVAVIAAIAAVAYLLIKNWDSVKKTFDSVKKNIVEFIDSTVGIENIKNAFNGMMEALKPIFDFLKQGFQGFMGFIEAIAPTIGRIGGVIGSVLATIASGPITMLVTIIGVAIMSVMNIIQGLATFLQGLGNLIAGIFTGDWGRAFDGLKQMVSGVVMVVTSVWRGFWGIISKPVMAVVNAVTSSFSSKVNAAKALYNTAKSLISKAIKSTISAITDSFHKKVEAVKKAWSRLKTFLQNPIKGIVNLFQRNNVDGSHRTGLSKVPFDGYIAELHSGEMVLRKDQAEEYRQGMVSNYTKKSTSKILNIKLADKVTINNTTDEDRLLRKLAKAVTTEV